MQVMQNGKGTLWSVDNSRATILPAFDRSSKRFTFYRVGLGSSDITPVLTIDQTPVSIALDLFGTVSDDGTRFAYFSQDAQHDLDLWLTNSDFAPPKRLTHLNPEFERYQMGSARLIDWLSLDGERLQGSLLLPSGYRPGNRYPLMLWVYGGAQGSDSLGSSDCGPAYSTCNYSPPEAMQCYSPIYLSIWEPLWLIWLRTSCPALIR